MSQMNKRFDSNGVWAHLMPKSMPKLQLEWIQIFVGEIFLDPSYSGGPRGNPPKISSEAS